MKGKMMQKEQPEALRLADLLETDWHHKRADHPMLDAATELRRLHAENEALRAQIGQGVPDGVLDALDNFEKKERSPFQAYLAAGLVNELRTAMLASTPPAPQAKAPHPAFAFRECEDSQAGIEPQSSVVKMPTSAIEAAAMQKGQS